MEKASCLDDSLEFLPFLNLFFNWVIKLQQSSLTFFCFVKFCSSFITSRLLNKNKAEKSMLMKVDEEEFITREEIKLVLQKMKFSYSSDEEDEGEQKMKDCLSFNELSTMFEEKEPSSEEIMDAFYVFDVNCDGFIDAKELQRVLSNLGLGKDLTTEDCSKMIAVHDEDSDGRIDLNEFVKFLQSSAL